MDSVFMILLYACILLISLVFFLWRRIHERFSKEALPMETGLTLKALVGDGPKSIPSKAIYPPQRPLSWKPKPMLVPKRTVERAAAPILNDSTATQSAATPIQEAAQVEQIAALPTPEPQSSGLGELHQDQTRVTPDPLSILADCTSPQASEPPAQELTEAGPIVPSVAADDSPLFSTESPIEESTEVEQIAALPAPEPLPQQAGELPVQEPSETEPIVPMVIAPIVTDEEATQASEPTVLKESTIEEIAPSATTVESVIQVSEPPARGAAAIEEVASSAPTNGNATAVPTTQPAVLESIRKETFSQSFLGVSTEEQPIEETFLSFYGLSEQPFGVTPDPAYLYRSQAHQEAFAALSDGIRNLRGFMALVAEPGMGKTTLLNKLMEELRDSARVVFLFQTQCNSRELLRYILGELDVPHAGMDLVAMHRALNEFLFQGLLEGRRFVLIVDEAQNLQDSALETIRLLSDFETTHAKLLQIVLAGQPQLADKLTRPNLSQLRQRIAVLANLEQLGAAETARYIEHRLRVAGSSGPIFTPEALALIAERSQGIPRNINNICCNALLQGFAQERQTIDVDIVRRAAGKLDLQSLVPARREQPRSIMNLAPPAPAPGLVQQVQAKAWGSLTGKVTELARSRPWSKDEEFKLQLLLERQPSPELGVADRYYSCSFYVSQEQARAFRLGQPIRIKFEQD